MDASLIAQLNKLRTSVRDGEYTRASMDNACDLFYRLATGWADYPIKQRDQLTAALEELRKPLSMAAMSGGDTILSAAVQTCLADLPMTYGAVGACSDLFRDTYNVLDKSRQTLRTVASTVVGFDDAVPAATVNPTAELPDVADWSAPAETTEVQVMVDTEPVTVPDYMLAGVELTDTAASENANVAGGDALDLDGLEPEEPASVSVDLSSLTLDDPASWEPGRAGAADDPEHDNVLTPHVHAVSETGSFNTDFIQILASSEGQSVYETIDALQDCTREDWQSPMQLDAEVLRPNGLPLLPTNALIALVLLNTFGTRALGMWNAEDFETIVQGIREGEAYPAFIEHIAGQNYQDFLTVGMYHCYQHEHFGRATGNAETPTPDVGLPAVEATDTSSPLTTVHVDDNEPVVSDWLPSDADNSKDAVARAALANHYEAELYQMLTTKVGALTMAYSSLVRRGDLVGAKSDSATDAQFAHMVGMASNLAFADFLIAKFELSEYSAKLLRDATQQQQKPMIHDIPPMSVPTIPPKPQRSVPPTQPQPEPSTPVEAPVQRELPRRRGQMRNT